MLYARVEHKELWTIIVILLTSMSYFDSAVLLDEAAQTDITCMLTRDWFYQRALHTGGWRVLVSPTLVELDSMNIVLSKDQKAITIPRCGFDA